MAQFRPYSSISMKHNELLIPKRTSKNPEMKFFGNLAFSSSSTLKYFMTCVLCFQKFSVSYRSSRVS